MQKDLKARVDWIDAAKGFCILLVVFHHVIVTSYSLPTFVSDSGSDIFSYFNEKISHYLAPLRMPLFFVISGMLVHSSVTKKSWYEVFDKRISNLVYLFLLWGVIQWLSVYGINRLGQPEVQLSSAVNALYSRELLEFIWLTLRGHSSLWYLYALVVYFIVCKSLARNWWLALATMLVFHWYGWTFGLSWPVNSIFINGIYFAFGCFWGSKTFALLSRLNASSLLLAASPIILFLLTKVLGFSIPMLLSFSIIFVGVPLFTVAQRIMKLSIVSWIGRNTLQIYVLHRIFIELVGVLVIPAMLDLNKPLDGLSADLWLLLYPSFATATIVVLSLLFWHLSNRGIGRALYNMPQRLKVLRSSCPSASLS